MAMSFTIGEVVSPLGKAEYDNDAQLRWYPNEPGNLKQTERYIWTSQAPTGSEPSLSLLRRVRNGFSSATEPNRFVFRATYGHGKTHLALANYFGKAQDSVEVENILAKIEGTSPNDAQAMRRFKELHAPFLVLRLRGDVMEPLPQQVLAGLETALHEQEATRQADLGLWFDQALGMLARMEEGALARMDVWLGEHGGLSASSYEALRSRLEARDSSFREIARGAVQAATGVMPDLGAAIAPGVAIEQVCRDFCGEGKPYAGLLILFDEFSLWVKDYARTTQGRVGAPLQSLLDGVHNARDKAVFVALAQQDPDKVVQLERAHGAMPEDMEGITKELNRLPDQGRFNLFSSLETVLDSYLKQDEAAWETLMREDSFYTSVIDGCDDVERLFPKRYSEQMGWGAEKIQSVLARGCFPLHPLTTAILCSLKLRAVGSTRPLMGFVAEALEEKRPQPALDESGPNWVYATALVPAFEAMIADTDEDWEKFRQAWKTAGAEHAPHALQQVLRAILLHESVQLPVGRGECEFARNLSALCGVPAKQVQAALSELEGLGAILHQPGRDVYTFFAPGQDGGKVEKWLRQEVSRLPADAEEYREALEWIADAEWWTPMEVKVDHGNASDWAAQVHLLPRALFEPKYLKGLLRRSGMKRDGSFEELARGFVLCPIATDDADALFFKENAARILDEALAEHSSNAPPVVVELSAWPQPNLQNALLRRWVLDNAPLEERNKDKDTFAATQSRVQKEAEAAIEEWKGGDLLVPLAFRPAMEAREVAGTSTSLGAMLPDLYQQAYRLRPPGFFRSYKADQRNLKNAVKMACEFLAGGTMARWGEVTSAGSFGTHRELLNQFLSIGNQEHWGVVNADGRLREPASERTRKAWQVLDETVPPGAEAAPLQPALEKLLNAPYGYDFNTLSLLVCSWFGFNRHHLTLESSASIEFPIEECLSEKEPRKILEKLCYTKGARLTRRVAPDSHQVDRIIREVHFGVERDEKSAREARAQLELYTQDENAEPERIKNARLALDQLNSDIKLLEARRAWVKDQWEKVSEVKKFSDALDAWNRIQSPPALGAVTPTPSAALPGAVDAAPDEMDVSPLREAAREQVRTMTDVACSSREKLSSLENYSKQKDELDRVRKHLSGIGQSEFLGRVNQAEAALEAARRALTDRDADKDHVAFLRSLTGLKTVPLATLREHVAQIESYTPRLAETQSLMDAAHASLQSAIADALAFLPPLEARLEAVVSAGEIKRLQEDIARRLDRFENSEEANALEAARKRLTALDATFDKLKDLSRDKPRDADALRNLGRQIDKLAEGEALSEPQRLIFRQTREAIEARFSEAIAQSQAALELFEARNAAGEDAVALKIEIEIDLERGLRFLPQESKTRPNALQRAVQKRIDADQIEKVKDEFQKILDRAKRAECLRALQVLAGQPPAQPEVTPVSVPTTATANAASLNGASTNGAPTNGAGASNGALLDGLSAEIPEDSDL